MIRLSDEQEAAIRAHAVRDYPYECCGALLGRVENGVKVIAEVRPIENTHEDGHERRFQISADQMFALMVEERNGGWTTLGFYHSHPDHPARPSQYDRDHAFEGYSYVIVSSRKDGTGNLTSWEVVENVPSFRAERIEPWEGPRQQQYEAVMAALTDEDRDRCLAI